MEEKLGDGGEAGDGGECVRGRCCGDPEVCQRLSEQVFGAGSVQPPSGEAMCSGPCLGGGLPLSPGGSSCIWHVTSQEPLKAVENRKNTCKMNYEAVN